MSQETPGAMAEAEGRPALELGATAAALRLEEDFAADPAAAGWTPAWGARAAWRPTPLVALGVEAWRADSDSDAGSVVGIGAHLRAAPFAGRGWPLEPALHFGIESVTSEDDEDRSVAFVAGGGLVRLARRWTLDLAVRNHRLSVSEDPVEGPGGPVATGRDTTLWEIRGSLAVVLGG